MNIDSEFFLSRLVKRGPDSQNSMRVDGFFELGMTRLAINDLSIHGNQPFVSENSRFYCVFNGELYNFKTLSTRINKDSIAVKSTSDGEVAFKYITAYGPDAYNDFLGMFAIAIYDLESKTLTLARDYFGEKPLFFTFANDSLLFCSEAGILCKYLKSIPIPEISMKHYLMEGYLNEDSLKNLGMRTIKPGSSVKFSINDNGIIASSEAPIFKTEQPRIHMSGNLKTHSIRVLDALENIVAQQIESSDVPIGVFLSGGIDSSIISALVKRVEPKSVLYHLDTVEASFSELDRAQFVADKLDMDLKYEPLRFDFENLISGLNSTDLPFADNSTIAFNQLCAFAAKEVKVCLSGDGADEIFFGYETYRATLLNYKLRFIADHIKRLEPFLNLNLTSKANVGWYEKIYRFVKFSSRNSLTSHSNWRQIFEDTEIDALLGKTINTEPAHRVFQYENPLLKSKDAILRNAQKFDIENWLVSDILYKLDRISMHNSLELRSPFLDKELFAMTKSIPTRMMVDLKSRKNVLYEIVRMLGLSEITSFPKKGFNSPFDTWLAIYEKEIKAIISDSEIFQKNAVDSLFNSYSRGNQLQSRKIYSLLSLANWELNRKSDACFQ